MSKYTAKQVAEIASTRATLHKVNGWQPARPYALSGVMATMHRIKLTLGVIVGRYDVLDWEDR